MSLELPNQLVRWGQGWKQEDPWSLLATSLAKSVRDTV